MARQGRAVTSETLGSWLVKCNPEVSPVADFLRTDLATVTSRCILPTYRADEVADGQRVLFWVSGNDARLPSGLYGHGHTTGPARTEGDELVMPVRLTRLDPPVLRRELQELPALSRLEVLRMPAGSNPSYVTREQLDEIGRRYPWVGVGSR